MSKRTLEELGTAVTKAEEHYEKAKKGTIKEQKSSRKFLKRAQRKRAHRVRHAECRAKREKSKGDE